MQSQTEETVIALAIILLLVAAALVVLMLIVGTGVTVTFATFAGNVVTRPIWIFLLGAVTLLIAMMGLSLLRTGTKRKVERRREIKRLRRLESEAHGPGSNSPRRDAGAGSASGGGTAEGGRTIDVRDSRGGVGAASAGDEPPSGSARRPV